jgi:hypothetical protein
MYLYIAIEYIYLLFLLCIICSFNSKV